MPQRKKGKVDPTLGRRVRAVRLQLHLTQGDLAGDDFSKGFISLVETGRTRMSLRAAEIVAKRLQMTLSELLEADPVSLDGGADVARLIETLADRVRDPLRVKVELRLIAAEIRRQRGDTVSRLVVHARAMRALEPLRELAEATA